MDIRKWLDQVEDGDAAPVQMTRRGDQKHSQHKKRLNVATDTGQQKRHRSDSSLLEPRPALQQEAPRRTKQATEESVDNCSSDHAPTHTNTDSESQNQPYARRARRKTRPDRYDPYPKKSKEAEPGTHRRKKGESKRSRRKTKNKKDEKSGNVLAQSFHAKNVSGDRLTLKPREQLGLFNKGKTSTAVKGRGLPDLVFSEMRFLQRNDEEPALNVQSTHTKPKKKRKSGHVCNKEGKISTYFSNPRPPLIEKEHNTRERRDRSSSKFPKLSRYDPERSSAFDSPIPTIKGPGKSTYLGFGGRGPPHGSTSYVSWSESVRPCSRSCPERHSRLVSAHHDYDTAQPSHDDNAHKPFEPKEKPPQFERGPQPGEGTVSNRLVVSTLESTSDRISRTQSLPVQTSSPHKHVDAKRIRSAAADVDSSSFPVRTTAGMEKPREDILSVHHVALERDIENSLRHTDPMNGSEVKEQVFQQHEHDSQSSSSLLQAIWQCDHTIQIGRQLDSRTRPVDVSPRLAPLDSVQSRGNGRLPASHHEAPTVRFSEAFMQHTDIRNFVGPGIYEQQEERSYPRFEAIDVDSDALHQHYLEHSLHDEDTENYDYVEDEGDGLDEEILNDTMRDSRDTTELYMEQAYECETPVRPIQSNNGAITSAFWRPNRLY